MWTWAVARLPDTRRSRQLVLASPKRNSDINDSRTFSNGKYLWGTSIRITLFGFLTLKKAFFLDLSSTTLSHISSPIRKTHVWRRYFMVVLVIQGKEERGLFQWLAMWEVNNLVSRLVFFYQKTSFMEDFLIGASVECVCWTSRLPSTFSAPIVTLEQRWWRDLRAGCAYEEEDGGLVNRCYSPPRSSISSLSTRVPTTFDVPMQQLQNSHNHNYKHLGTTSQKWIRTDIWCVTFPWQMCYTNVSYRLLGHTLDLTWWW